MRSCVGSARFIAAIRQRPLSSSCIPRDDLSSALFYFIIVKFYYSFSQIHRIFRESNFSSLVSDGVSVRCHQGQRGDSASWWPERRSHGGGKTMGLEAEQSQGSGWQPRGSPKQVPWVLRSLETTLSWSQLGLEAELTLPNSECCRAGPGK